MTLLCFCGFCGLQKNEPKHPNIMKTRKYKTLKSLLKQVDKNYGLNYNSFHCGMFHHKTAGLVKFKLPDDQLTLGYLILTKTVWERNASTRVSLLERYSGYPHGILDRLRFRTNGKIEAEYVAGQYYPGEIRCVQGIFRNNG